MQVFGYRISDIVSLCTIHFIQPFFSLLSRTLVSIRWYNSSVGEDERSYSFTEQVINLIHLHSPSSRTC